MISALFVKDPVYQEEIDDSSSEVDDSFTCRTDQTTVRVSNVRRVTFTAAMDNAAVAANQLVLRLFAHVSDHHDRCALLAALSSSLQIRHIQPVNAVHSLWELFGFGLSEEIYHDLARFSGSRRDEFIDALTRFIEHMEPQSVMGTAQDASSSSSSSLMNSVAISGGAATSDGVVSTACSLASDIRSAASSTTVLPNLDETIVD